MLGDTTYYFSYETLVAVKQGSHDFRIEYPTSTTNKHMKKMGCKKFAIVNQNYFDTLVKALGREL